MVMVLLSQSGQQLVQARLVASSLALMWALADHTRNKADKQIKDAGVLVSSTLEKVGDDGTFIQCRQISIYMVIDWLIHCLVCHHNVLPPPRSVRL